MDLSVPLSSNVREFHEALVKRGCVGFKLDKNLYQAQDEEAGVLLTRCKLIEEECYELIDALQSENLENVLKEACDVVYVVMGALATFGIDRNFLPAYNRVSENNMLKVNTGTVIDGKLVKPANHPSVVLDDLVS